MCQYRDKERHGCDNTEIEKKIDVIILRLMDRKRLNYNFHEINIHLIYLNLFSRLLYTTVAMTLRR